MEHRMPYYRLYLTDAAGRILRCKDFVIESDVEAIGYADDLRAGASAELWQEHRKVETFAAAQEARRG
jgi:hypothetical protein